MKEIGGDFKMPLKYLFSKGKNNLSDDCLFLSTGRDCLEYIIRSLGLKEGDVVLLPSYLCWQVLVPFKEHKLKIRFYKLDEELRVIPQDFLGEISKGDVKLAMIINYFGFPQKGRTDIKLACEQQGVVLLENHVQSFLSEYSSVGDITFNSYRKVLPLPDGAMLRGTIRKKVIPVRVYPKKFVNTRIIAGLLKNIFFLKFVWRPLFMKTEEKLVTEIIRPASMSNFSKGLLKKIDLFKIIDKRRKNYETLLKGLRGVEGVKPLYDYLPDDVCPFGFPIICDNRDELRKYLISKRIYPPIHWAVPKDITKDLFPDSYFVSDHIMTIPIDQRYDEEDMNRIIAVIKK